MKERPLILISLIFIISTISCKFDLPTGPETKDKSVENSVRNIWDPYIGVHPFAFDAGLQQPHLLKLIQAGALRGVRLYGLEQFEVRRFANWFIHNGVEVLGLFHHSGYEVITNPNICQIFSQHVAQNPGITTWQIGSEVSGFYKVNVSPEEYMKIFKKLFYYAKQYHPNITLISQAPPGNGRGADELRRMIDAGLDELCRDGLKIVAIHFYSWESSRLAEFKSQIARLPAYVRIWITECNEMPPHWSTCIGFVKEMYPKLRSSLRAERIYWYIFAEGRDFYNGEFGLVRGLADGPPLEYSPLMNALIGANQDFESSGFVPESFPDAYQGPHYPGKKLNRDREKPKKKRQQ